MTKPKHRIPKRYLILCEGETEVRYFKSYRMADENRDRLRGVEVDIYRPVNHSPVGLVREAKNRLKEAKRDGLPEYESIWIVFDKNGHANIPNAFHEARTSNPEIQIAFSAVCFEYWILLHYEQRKIFFQNGDAIVSYLKQKCMNNYTKAKVGYRELKGLLETALKNSKWLHKQNKLDLDNGIPVYKLDAYTNIDELMNLLENLSRP